MAKMKVYELAKELDVQSKDVVAYLTENGSSVKSHASNIEDKEIEMVRSKFGKTTTPAPKPAVKAEPAAPQAEAVKPVVKPAAPQANTAQTRPAASAATAQRPQGEMRRPMSSDRPVNRPMGQSERPQGDRPMRPQGDRPQGDRPMRPQGDRPM